MDSETLIFKGIQWSDHRESKRTFIVSNVLRLNLSEASINHAWRDLTQPDLSSDFTLICHVISSPPPHIGTDLFNQIRW